MGFYPTPFTRLLYGAISCDVIGTATPFLYVQSPHPALFSFCEERHKHFLDPKFFWGGLGLFIIHCKDFFHLALTKVTLVPPCQNLFATFIHLNCFQEVTGTLHNSFLLLTIYAVFSLDEPSVRFSRISFKESLAITLAKYSCANNSNNQLALLIWLFN